MLGGIFMLQYYLSGFKIVLYSSQHEIDARIANDGIERQLELAIHLHFMHVKNQMGISFLSHSEI